MEGLFLQHGAHAGCEWLEGRGREHAQLELSVPVNEHGVAEEIQPVWHGSIEGAQQSVAVLSVALEELLCLTSSLLAEIGHEEVSHLPAVALFLGHDAGCSVAVIIGWCGCEKVSLLLDRGELGVALNGDHADQRIPHALVWDLKRTFPLGAASVVAELNHVASTLPVKLNGEVEIAHPFSVVADVVLPGLEVLNPVVPGLR